MQRTFGSYILLGVRGMAIGAADLIPGVSGGTVAFITGIYEELVNSIKSINHTVFKTLFQKGVAQAWKQINGNFLFAVVFGLFISLFSLAGVLSWLLSNHQMMVWAFFFGLIVGSAIFVGKTIKSWGLTTILSFLAGILVAYFITLATPATTPDGLVFIFLAGSIAICAMILPGISGAFILLLIGKYEHMLNAVKNFQIVDLLVFALGCIVGVIAFSNVISWLLKKYRQATLALLTGFMIGSLNKIWPWKQVTLTGYNSQGEEIPLVEKSILPGQFQQISGESPMLLEVTLLALLGFVLVLGFDYMGARKKQH